MARVAYEGGGYSFSVGDNTNQSGSLTLSTNTWTPLAPVPDLFNAEASGVYPPNVNKLFVFGGDSPNAGTVVNTTRIYDIATNTWIAERRCLMCGLLWHRDTLTERSTW